MTRAILTVLAVALLSATVAGCAGNLSELEQNQARAEYRCKLMPGRECRW